MESEMWRKVEKSYQQSVVEVTEFLHKKMQYLNTLRLWGSETEGKLHYTFEPWHVISNNVAFRQVWTQTSLCSLLLSLETPDDVQSVA